MQANSNQNNNQMKKLILSLVLLAFVWVSCENQTTNQQDDAKNEAIAELTPKKLDINKFDEMAGDLANQLIEIQGTVMHTCKHGGTKMFISGNDPDFRVKIMATDESGNFSQEMEGTDYIVVGILDEYRVDNAELDRLEAEVLSGEEEGEEEMKHKEGEHSEDDHADHGEGEGDMVAEKEGSCEIQGQLDQINDLRQELKDSGKEYLSFFSIQAKSFKTVEK